MACRRPLEWLVWLVVLMVSLAVCGVVGVEVRAGPWAVGSAEALGQPLGLFPSTSPLTSVPSLLTMAHYSFAPGGRYSVVLNFSLPAPDAPDDPTDHSPDDSPVPPSTLPRPSTASGLYFLICASETLDSILTSRDGSFWRREVVFEGKVGVSRQVGAESGLCSAVEALRACDLFFPLPTLPTHDPTPSDTPEGPQFTYVGEAESNATGGHLWWGRSQAWEILGPTAALSTAPVERRLALLNCRHQSFVLHSFAGRLVNWEREVVGVEEANLSPTGRPILALGPALPARFLRPNPSHLSAPLRLAPVVHFVALWVWVGVWGLVTWNLVQFAQCATKCAHCGPCRAKAPHLFARIWPRGHGELGGTRESTESAESLLGAGRRGRCGRGWPRPLRRALELASEFFAPNPQSRMRWPVGVVGWLWAAISLRILWNLSQLILLLRIATEGAIVGGTADMGPLSTAGGTAPVASPPTTLGTALLWPLTLRWLLGSLTATINLMCLLLISKGLSVTRRALGRGEAIRVAGLGGLFFAAHLLHHIALALRKGHGTNNGVVWVELRDWRSFVAEGGAGVAVLGRLLTGDSASPLLALPGNSSLLLSGLQAVGMYVMYLLVLKLIFASLAANTAALTAQLGLVRHLRLASDLSKTNIWHKLAIFKGVQTVMICFVFGFALSSVILTFLVWDAAWADVAVEETLALATLAVSAWFLRLRNFDRPPASPPATSTDEESDDSYEGDAPARAADVGKEQSETEEEGDQTQAVGGRHDFPSPLRDEVILHGTATTPSSVITKEEPGSVGTAGTRRRSVRPAVSGGPNLLIVALPPTLKQGSQHPVVAIATVEGYEEEFFKDAE